MSKKYLTSEAIAMLEKNPKAILDNEIYWITVKDNHVRASFDKGNTWVNWYGSMQPYEWELIQQPVDFLTAVKAYSEGKTIRCELKGEITVYRPSFKSLKQRLMFELKGGHTRTVDADEILNGTWYIEEGESNA
jgi:hypothetical protein